MRSTNLLLLLLLLLKLFHCTTAALPPLTAVGRYSLPAHVINVAGFQVDTELVFVSSALDAWLALATVDRRFGMRSVGVANRIPLPLAVCQDVIRLQWFWLYFKALIRPCILYFKRIGGVTSKSCFRALHIFVRKILGAKVGQITDM